MEDLRARTTLFCAILAIAIALSMLLRRRRNVHWLFTGFATCLALWYVTQSLASLLQATLYERATAVLTVILPQLAVHLFQAIVPEVPDPVFRGKLGRWAAAIGLPLLGLELSPYHEHPVALGLVYAYVLVFLAAALVGLWQRGKLSPSRTVRDRVRFLAAVGALATTFTLADFTSFLGLNLPPIGAVLSIVFLFVLSESLTRPRLADLYELAGRLMVSTTLAFALAGIFYGFITYVGRFGAMYLNAVLAAIIFLVVFEPLQNEIRTRIHQFFFRERYDLETSVAELRRKLTLTLEPEDMVTTLLDGLERSRRTTSAAVYLLDADDGGFRLAGQVGVAGPARLDTLALRPLLDRLDRSMSLEEYTREVTDTEQKPPDPAVVTAASTLGGLASSVLLAIRGDEDALVGLVCVADDRVRDAFTHDEIALLETVAAQLGVALANSRVYARMKERDRLAALGAMSAGLAHEVKNPLGAIKGAAQLLEEAALDTSAREFLGIILEETDRLNRVVGSFLDYARPTSGIAAPIDLNGAVTRTIQILSPETHGDDVDLSLELADDLPPVRIDAEQFRQVLMNLVQNAMQAMDGHGTVTVTTGRRRTQRGDLGEPPPSSVERHSSSRVETIEVVEVSVRDRGPGIAPKVLKNLFVPFFTTKDRGTGLGLAICQRLVQNAGGIIEVQSQPGTGTKFTVILPAATGETATPPLAESLPPVNRSASVL